MGDIDITQIRPLSEPLTSPVLEAGEGKSKDAYTRTQTAFQFPWPPGLSGIERVVLSACGDLQRVLSAFFGHPITVRPQSKHVSPCTSDEVSLETPVTQERVVHLVCFSRVVVIASSVVYMFHPTAAALILDESFAIGQAYRQMGVSPQFELESVTVDLGSDEKERITRRYWLKTELMHCRIEEIFVDRAMFTEEQWLEKSARPSKCPCY